ncbi:NAD(P)-dependent oxidoreductase [Dermatophilaceae bacterium Soc4.6]
MTEASTNTVLVTGESVSRAHLQRLTDAGLIVINPAESFPPAILAEDDLAHVLEPCVGYILGGDEVASRKVLERARSLKVLAFLGVGYESFVDTEAATDLHIPVTSTPGVLANSVAEFTVGLLLDARRNITRFATEPGFPQNKARDLSGHAVGIVGLGAAGSRIAEILRKGFGAEVSYFSRTRKPALEESLGIRYASLEDITASVESLILMVPETPDTTNLLTSSLLLSRSSSNPMIVINTARAEVIEPQAILQAVESGAVSALWFDGYYRDATDATRSLEVSPSVFVTPHVASLTHDARDAMSTMAVESILKILKTGSDEAIVNPTYLAQGT